MVGLELPIEIRGEGAMLLWGLGNSDGNRGELHWRASIFCG